MAQMSPTRRSAMLMQLLRQQQQMANHKGTRTGAEAGLRILGQVLNKKKQDKLFKEQGTFDKQQSVAEEAALAQMLGGGAPTMDEPMKDFSGRPIQGPQGQFDAEKNLNVNFPDSKVRGAMMQEKLLRSRPAPKQPDHPDVKRFETVTEWDVEGRGTPEYQAAYLEFMKANKQAQVVVNNGKNDKPTTVFNLAPHMIKKLDTAQENGESGRITHDISSEMVDILDSEAGVLTGAASNVLQTLAQGLTMIGEGQDDKADGLFSQSSDALANTQMFESKGGVLVGQIIRLFGSGTGLSDADREYAAAIAGAVATRDSRALRGILAGGMQRGKHDVDMYNSTVQGFNTGGISDVGNLYPNMTVAQKKANVKRQQEIDAEAQKYIDAADVNVDAVQGTGR